MDVATFHLLSSLFSFLFSVHFANYRFAVVGAILYENNRLKLYGGRGGVYVKEESIEYEYACWRQVLTTHQLAI